LNITQVAFQVRLELGPVLTLEGSEIVHSRPEFLA